MVVVMGRIGRIARALGVYRALKACLPKGFRSPAVAEWLGVGVPVPPLHVEHCSYSGRDLKALHVAWRYGEYFRDSVLDVGCDRCQLRDALNLPFSSDRLDGMGIHGAVVRPNIQYTGIDRTDEADHSIDLNDCYFMLTFEEDSYDTVVCLDVLEHLSDPDGVMWQLARIARRFIIVSLPNCWFGAYDHLARGCGTPRHYGLHPDGPADGHRWWFNFDDADHWLQWQAKRNGLTIRERVAEWRLPDWPWWKRPWHLARFLFGRRNAYRRQRYFQTVWYVFEKKG